MGVFRKHLSSTAEKTKYPTIVRTAEDILAEEQNAEREMEDDVEEAPQIAVSAPKAKKNYTIEDIMSLDKSLKITKKKVKSEEQVPVKQEKSKGIVKKKKHAKRS